MKLKTGILLFILVFLMLSGYAGNQKGSATTGLEKEVFPLVEKYLESAADGNWNEVYETLAGEALMEARTNAGRVKIKEKIVSKKLKVSQSLKDIVEVKADFTISRGSGFDRRAYTFRLKKSGDKWLIYKTDYGDYQHDPLKFGELPQEAVETIKAYYELTYTEKRSKDHIYLAGKLLADSQKARLLPTDTQSANEREKMNIRVTEVEPIGQSEDFIIARISYNVTKNDTVVPMQAIVENILVNGVWKITRIDISGL